MSFARPVPSKSNGTSTVIPPLPALPKLPSRLQSKTYLYFINLILIDIFFVNSPSVLPTAAKKEIKIQENKNDIQLSSIPNQNDLKEIVK